MKRVLPILLSLLLVFSLSACKDKEELQNADNSSAEALSGDVFSKETQSAKKCDHTFAAATCTEPRICKKCKQEVGTPLGHKWKEATCQTFKTCKVCNKIEGEVLEHEYVKGYCKYCKEEDPNLGQLNNHTWQLFENGYLTQINFENSVFSQGEMQELSKFPADDIATMISSTGYVTYDINGKHYAAIDGQGFAFAFKEEKDIITIMVADSDSDQNEKIIVLKKLNKTQLKVTKCTLKGGNWQISVGDVLKAFL